MRKYCFLLLLPLLFSCRSIVNPNEWVVTTGTCWNTYSITEAGDYVPRLYTTCDRMIILPATQMGADFTAETKFKDKVAATVAITYQWRIVNPIKFVKNAKSITSSPTSDDHKVDPNALEELENTIVDKALIDVLREYTPNKAADTPERELEKDLATIMQDQVDERGVEFSNVSINVTLSPQIEEALDILSALAFYERYGERELGEEVIKRKAGAASISNYVKEE